MKNLLLALLLVSNTVVFAGKPNHSTWNDLLKKHVSSSGKVNYKGLKGDMSKIETYITELSKNTPESSWSSNDKKAYWINAYNVFTIKLILDHYPLKSITNIKIGGKDAWNHKFIELGGTKYTLNDIEKTKLLKELKDERVHFLINCASFSCPILVNKAVYPENVEDLLTQQTKKFLNDKSRNKISYDKLELSEIFNWYKSDFGDVHAFIKKYSGIKISDNAKISYISYNWNLNE